MKWFILCGTGLLVLFLGCHKADGYQDISAYHYPYADWPDGQVYKYESAQGDSLVPYYNFIRPIVTDTADHLALVRYEHDGIPSQISTLRLSAAGVEMKQLILAEAPGPDGRQPTTQAEILADDVFPYRVRPEGGIFLNKVRFRLPTEPDVTTTLVRNRRYLRDTTYRWQRNEIPAIVFEVREIARFDDVQQGGIEQEVIGQEVYAKGVGLVYVERLIGGQLRLAYRLSEILSMEELEQRVYLR